MRELRRDVPQAGAGDAPPARDAPAAGAGPGAPVPGGGLGLPARAYDHLLLLGGIAALLGVWLVGAWK